jgi:hypothetical protein
MPYFNLKSFTIYNNITHEKMNFDSSEIDLLYHITYDYDTYAKNGNFYPEDFHNFLKNISKNFPDVEFNVSYKYDIHCAHCCKDQEDPHKDEPPCIYSNQLKICNSIIKDRLIG